MTSKFHYFMGTGAAGGVVAPTTIYGEFLTTNGFWMISLAEWMKVIGTMYIILLIISLLIKAGSYIIGKFKDNAQTQPENTNRQDDEKIPTSNKL